MAKGAKGSTKSESSQNSAIVSAYLIFYNSAQCLGWMALLFMMCLHYTAENTTEGMYHALQNLLYVFQTAALLEVVHALTGIVRSNWVLTGFQVASRVFITWGIAYSVPEVQNKISVLMFLLAWSVTEVVRYSFYAFNIIGQVPPLLVWLRYTLFIVLYPIGVLGELLTIYGALPYIQRSRMFSVAMPNTVNMSFNYYYFLFLVMASYIPVFPQLYMHMLAQRKKILGDGKKKAA